MEIYHLEWVMGVDQSASISGNLAGNGVGNVAGILQEML